MIEQEFKTQIFKTPDQWEKGGLLYKLDILKEGGITLYPIPTFVRWIAQVNGIRNPAGLAVNECGQVYFIDAETCRLYLYDPGTQRLEEISCIGGCDSDPGKFLNPGQIIVDRFTLWIVDAGNSRIQAFSRDNYQIKYIIDNLEEPVDIGLDEQCHLFVLDLKPKQIFQYDNNGLFIKNFGKSRLEQPVGLAVGKEDFLYVIDRGYNGFLIFTEQGEYVGTVGDFNKISGDFQPSTIAIDRKGNIFVGDSTSGLIHQFDSDGSHIGKIQIPDFTGPVQGLAIDSKGNLYVSGSKGIAFLSAQQTFTKEKGFYYSKTLDSGMQDCQWHRLALKADMPPKTDLEIYFYASDDLELKETIDEVLSDPGKSTQEKADFMYNKIPWIGPEKNPEDMLFRGKTGRYLWLMLVLSTFDEKGRPSVTQIKVFYPRISYLRYLPAIYQEDPVSREFLERFLSVFETVSYDLETEISSVFKYFDPDTVPQNFLTWLASWLNVALEEDWPENKKRQFIREASTLYKLKGTPSGIRKSIEIYTGKIPLILEHSRVGKPMVLGGDFKLGVNSLLIQTPVRGFRLGDDSILGRVALRDNVQLPEDPFLPMAHRFTVILDLSPEEFSLYEKGLIRILNQEKPAHTGYNLRIVNEMRVGLGTYVGINTRVADYRPIEIGVDSVLGTGLIVFDSGETCGKVERRSKVEVDTLLI